MKTQSLSLWWLRIATLSIAALAAASAAYWVLKWTAGAPAAAVLPAAPSLSQTTQTDPQVVARLLGGGQKAVVAALADSAASRFKLMGVIANPSKRGYALISVDGKPAKPYGVGAQVNEAMVLHSVAPRSAALAPSADAPVSFTLQLPTPVPGESKAATATPSASAASASASTAATVSAPAPAIDNPTARTRNRARSSSE